jgi:hypothetical protein
MKIAVQSDLFYHSWIDHVQPIEIKKSPDNNARAFQLYNTEGDVFLPDITE